MQTKVLVVVAHEDESDYVPADNRVEVIYTGIGKLNAALKVSNYLEAQKEHNANYIILNIGTCGSPNYPVGSLVIPEKIYQGNCLFEMEAYAIVSLASESMIPFYCIKVVSDNCGGTQKDWENTLSQIRPEVGKAISNFCKEILH